jgi:hypothetical protein
MDLIESNFAYPLEHWYYAHKFNSIKKLIKSDVQGRKTLIDVGAGSALFSLELLRTVPDLVVIAIDTGYANLESIDLSGKITYKQNGSGVSGDLYLFTDVLEHVINDVVFLSDYVRGAPVGSKFAITVPAFMSLWSGHDVFLKHYRRYRRKELVEVVNASGLEVRTVRYLYVVLFPIAWIIRKLPRSREYSSQMKDHGVIVNCLAKSILKVDGFFAKFIPFGISLLVVAEKKN